MGIKDEIGQPIVIDGKPYNFDSKIRIKINQFYDLDILERARILLLAEKTDTALNVLNIFNQNATQEFNDLKTTVPKLAERNTYSGINQYLNSVDLDKNMTMRGNTIVQLRGENIEGVPKTVLDIGNNNYVLNLIGTGKLLFNGQELKVSDGEESRSKVETIFEGLIKIKLNSGFFGDNGIVVEYSYANLVIGKNYNLLFFEFQDDMERDFSFMREYNGDRYYLSGVTVKNKTAIFRKGTNPVFYIKIDDEQKKIYIAYQNTNLSYICLKRIIGI